MSSIWYQQELDASFSSIPRPEYPRPDFQRGMAEGYDWINLNGLWEFEFDPENRGEKENWPRNAPGFSRSIVVPFPWESHAAWGESERASRGDWFSRHAFLDPAAVDRSNYRTQPRHEIGWYQTVTTVPTHWASKRVILHFGASDWETRVWVNGRLMGTHQGGYEPFSFDVTDAAPAGETIQIMVRVFDPTDHCALPAGKQINWYTRTSGIWQTVYLEPRAASHISRIHITPDIDTAQARFDIDTEGKAGDLRISVTAADGRVFTVSGPADTPSLTLDLPSPLLWSPQTPHLYQTTVELYHGAEPVDRVNTYFGMRKVSIAALPGTGTRYVFLNNRPIYLRGALNQSFNPWGVYTFPSDEAIREDLQRTLDFGFNFLRMHIKIEEPRFLYWADRMGVLLMCDIPNFDSEGYGPEAHSRWEATLRAAVERDFNHPSIFSWICFNETWGLGYNAYKSMPERHTWVAGMYHLARSLDPTRIIEDNSPCFYDHVETQINTWHFYINDYQKAKDHIATVVKETYPGSGFNYAPGHTQGDEPLMNSEYGGISASMGDKDVSWCFRFLTNELRLHEKICGYIYTELQDIEWEHNGFMNYDRTVKEFGYDYRMINAADMVIPDAPPGQTLAGGTRFDVDVYTSHFSDSAVETPTLRWRLDSVDCWGADHEGVDSGSATIAFTPFRVELARRIGVTLPRGNHLCALHIWVEDVFGSTVARNFTFIETFDGPLSEIDAQPEFLALRFDVKSGTSGGWASEHAEEDILIGVGSGYREYVVEIPEDFDLSRVEAVEVWAELSAGRGEAPQTESARLPGHVRVALNGTGAVDIALANAPADTRGALSYLRGSPGRYGELIRLIWSEEDMTAALASLTSRRLALRLEVDASSAHPNGLAIYGARAGRFPVQPCVVFRLKT